MTTLSNLVESTRQHLLSGHREPLNKLAVAATINATSLTFTYPINFKAGALLQIDTELFHVWSVNTVALTAAVEPARDGSTSAAHVINSLVAVNPRFPTTAVIRALNDELASLSSPANGLFQVRYADLTPNAARTGYDLAGATSVLDVMEVRQRTDNTAEKNWPRLPFSFDRSVSATDFPSGFALFLPGHASTSQSIRVQYRAPFTPLVNLADDVLTVAGLPTSAHDIPPLGAAWRLVAGREIKRNFTEAQGDTRRAQEVSPGAMAASARNLAALRQQRIMEEATSLQQLYPLRAG